MKHHKDLDAWRSAILLAKNVYQITKSYPREELFGLSAQMRRAAVSIASNIAEGASRRSDKEFVWFLGVALGSASELDTHLEISKAVEIVDLQRLNELQRATEQTARLLQGLIRYVKDRQP